MRNPFEFGRELAASELVDRAPELAAVERAIAGSEKLFLIGPRRYGKTSILKAAADRQAREGAIVLRYDAEAFPSLEGLASRLLTDTATRLASTAERVGALLKQFFQALRPRATFDPADASWSISLGGIPGREAGVPLLADVLDGVERAAARADRPVAVLIDEFQKVVQVGGEPAEAQIRAAVQKHRRVGYVFAGSATRLLSDMTGDPKRPFYKLGTVLFLGPVPRADFARFIGRGFAKADIPVEDGAVDALLDAAEEVPYNVQLLAHEAWERCREQARVKSGPAPLSERMVRETLEIVARRNDPLYTALWAGLPASQQRALLIVLSGASALMSSELLQRWDLAPSTMQRALGSLEDKGILRTEYAEGGRKLRMEDPVFAEWIRLIVPSSLLPGGPAG